MTTSNRILPMGVLVCIDGDYYVAEFDHPMDPLVVTAGTDVEIRLDTIRIVMWRDPQTIGGLLPLKAALKVNPLRPLEPLPPKFASVEEAEDWLRNHPARLDTGAEAV